MNELLRAAFVIARRDFSAVIFSKSFILFLIVPLFPLAIGAAGGWVGGQMASESMHPTVGVVMPAPQADALVAARARLGDQMRLPDLRRYPATTDPRTLLARKDDHVIATLSGTLEKPLLSGNAGDVEGLKGDIALLASVARAGKALPVTALDTHMTRQSEGSLQQARLATGRGAQTLLFLLTVVLAGMVLSNMVEEKTNKIIEILAAAVPIDAIFLGKLMAMLAMSFIGIAVWGGCAMLAGTVVPSLSGMTAPAVGWPLFVLLGFLCFATAYTLLGSLFIGIGAQANTVREVQTLSMPITMCQVPIFLFTTYASSRMGETPELVAAIFPFSSPFAMIARAAQSDALWPHLLAIIWQLLWVAVIIRIGVRLFRRNVLKSGKPTPRRSVFARRRASRAPSET